MMRMLVISWVVLCHGQYNIMIMKILEIYNELFEARDYKLNDIVDSNDIDLQAIYDKYNKLAFGNKLKRVPLEFRSLKRYNGYVRAEEENGKFKIVRLAMSNFNNMTYGAFINVFVHEMIHVYLYQKNIQHNHDEPFLKEMNRINGMGLGLNITINDEYDTYKDMYKAITNLTKNVKPKKLMFYLQFDKNNRMNAITVMTYDTYKNKKKIISNMVKQHVDEKTIGSFWLSNDVFLQGFPIQSIGSNGFDLFPIYSKDLNRLLKNATKLSEFVTDGKNVIWK